MNFNQDILKEISGNNTQIRPITFGIDQPRPTIEVGVQSLSNSCIYDQTKPTNAGKTQTRPSKEIILQIRPNNESEHRLGGRAQTRVNLILDN